MMRLALRRLHLLLELLYSCLKILKAYLLLIYPGLIEVSLKILAGRSHILSCLILAEVHSRHSADHEDLLAILDVWIVVGIYVNSTTECVIAETVGACN